MSRSRRKTPIIGVCGGSDKEDKRLANRGFRRAVKQQMVLGEEPSLTDIRETSNVYNFSKDGKTFLNLNKEWNKKYMRK